MQDEGFHEIQLNGKQLVFLFMAGTVVAVVIFLCGVMVGRGVPERTLVAGAVTAAPLDPAAALPPASSSSASTGDTQPLTAGETLTYPSLLENPDPPAETLAPAAEPAIATATPKPAAAPPPEPKPLPAPMPKPAPPKPAPVAAPPVAAAPKPVIPAPKPVPLTPPVAAAAASSLNEPAGSGFVVQVAAVRQRAEADRIAQRLTGKGYPAFVTTSGANFRVRVGKFDDRRQAETVAGRLEREEQFKPWITR